MLGWRTCFPQSQVRGSSNSIKDGSKISHLKIQMDSPFSSQTYPNVKNNSHQIAIKLKLWCQRPHCSPSHVEGEPTQGHLWPRQPCHWTKMDYGIVHDTPIIGYLMYHQFMTIGCWQIFINFSGCCFEHEELPWFRESPMIPFFFRHRPCLHPRNFPERHACHSWRSFERVQVRGPTQLRWATKKRLQSGWFTSR